MTATSLESRIERLESQNKRQRLAIIALLLCFTSVCLVSARSLLEDQGTKTLTLKHLVVDKIEAKEIRLEQTLSPKTGDFRIDRRLTAITPGHVDCIEIGDRYRTLYDGMTADEVSYKDLDIKGLKKTVVRLGRFRMATQVLPSTIFLTNHKAKASSSKHYDPFDATRLTTLGSTHILIGKILPSQRVAGISERRTVDLRLRPNQVILSRNGRASLQLGEFTHVHDLKRETKYPLGTITLFNDKHEISFQAPGK